MPPSGRFGRCRPERVGRGTRRDLSTSIPNSGPKLTHSTEPEFQGEPPGPGIRPIENLASNANGRPFRSELHGPPCRRHLESLPLTIADAAAALRAGTLTSAQLTASCLDRIESSQTRLGAFVTVCREGAMAAAEAADEALAAGTDLGPLMGIPLAVKDLIATRDAPTTANSRVLDSAWGRGIDSPAVVRLRAAGSARRALPATAIRPMRPGPVDDALCRNMA